VHNQSWFISKCDRCGDQTFFYNIFIKSLVDSGTNVIHVTNEINTYLSYIIKGSVIFRYEISESLDSNISKFNEIVRSNDYIIIICPFVPYEETSNIILDNSTLIGNWIRFLRNIEIDVTVCGTINPSWIDLVNCSMVSSDEKFYGLVDKPSQNVPRQFQKWSSYEIEDFIEIKNEIYAPELFFVGKILTKFEIPKPSLAYSLIHSADKILFFVGASSIQKCYNYESILRLGESLMEKCQSEILFVYGPNELNLYTKYCDNKNNNHIYFESGQFDQLIELITSARLAFTHDTFYYHLLNLYGIPHVLVSGGGHWKRFTYANSISTIITNRLPCFNCDWICSYSKSFCISEISEKGLLNCFVERYKDPNLGFKVYNSDADIELYDYTVHFENESIYSNYIAKNNEDIANEIQKIKEEREDIANELTAIKEENKRKIIELSEKQYTLENLLIKNNQNLLEINRYSDENKSLMHKICYMQHKLNNIYLENEKNKRSLELMSRVIDRKINYNENNDC
jgi:hypothetical protein